MVAVPPRENAFVVNLGDVMTLLTGNYFVATPHRVVARNDRFAIGFFYGPSLDTELAPLPLAPKFAAVRGQRLPTRDFSHHRNSEKRRSAKTGSGQALGKIENRRCFRRRWR